MPTVGIVVDECEGDEAHYCVSLLIDITKPAGDHMALLPRPLPAPPGVELDLATYARGLLAVAQPDAASLRELGRHLWDLLLPPPVGPAWAAINADATLLDIRAQDLQRLPWELLQDDLGLALFTVPASPIARARLDVGPAPELDLPMRVLAVVGEPGDPQLKWADEIAALEVLGGRHPDRFHVEVLLAPDLADLRQVCMELRPHVLHVIAHGQVVAGAPSLRVAATTPWLLDPQAVLLVTNTNPATTFPLVVLNGCHTGDPGALDGALGLAEMFRRRQSLATVCMLGAVQGAAAAEFAAVFYGALLDGRRIDTACAEARATVAVKFASGIDSRLPALDLTVVPAPLMPVRQPVAPLPLGAIDRATERRRLLFALEPPDPSKPPVRAAIVRGDPGVGKTWVAQGMAHLFHARGGTVRYVDLDGNATLGWLDVLRAIRDTRSPSAPFATLAPELFSAFNEGVNEAAKGNPLKPTPPPGPVADLGLDIGAVNERTLDHIGALYGVFRTALAAAAEGASGRRLLLVVDHVERVATTDLGDLVDKLFLPIAKGDVPGVELVVVAGPGALDPLRDHGLTALAQVVPVQSLGPADFAMLASVFWKVQLALGLCDEEHGQVWDAYVNARPQTKTWNLKKLHDLLELAKQD